MSAAAPMRVIDIQHGMRELGRIRMGAAKAGNAPGKKLTTFRLTSRDEHAIRMAAKEYGGEVLPWQNPSDGSKQFQVIVKAEELPVLISPIAASQAYEMWTAGGCQKRCDGCTEMLSGTPCSCDPDPKKRAELAKTGKNCKLTTRLGFMLPGVPDLGVWRLESHGYYAAVELPRVSDMLSSAARQGAFIPAFIAIEIRTSMKGGKKKVYPVPVIRLRYSMSQIPAIAAAAKEIGSGTAIPLMGGMQALAENAESLEDSEDEAFVPDDHADDHHGPTLTDGNDGQGALVD